MAGYEVDISHDFEDVTDNLTTYTLKVEGAEDVVLTKCVMSVPIDTVEIEPSGGQTVQMDQEIVWPRYKSNKPPLGSVLVDEDGVYWTILGIRYKQHVECWEARCRNLDIVDGEINDAVIVTAEYSKGRANEARALWVGLISGQHPVTQQDKFKCRIQPAMEMARLKFGTEFTNETYRVILQGPVPLKLANGEYRLVNAAGERFRIMQYFDEQRIGRYPMMLVVKIIEGREHWHHGHPPTPMPGPVFPTR